MMFFSALSMFLTMLGLAFATPLLIAMRTAPEALPLAVPYMRVMLLARAATVASAAPTTPAPNRLSPVDDGDDIGNGAGTPNHRPATGRA